MAKRWMAVGLLMMAMSAGLPSLMAGESENPAIEGIGISDVFIQGNKRIPTEKIKTILHTRAGEKYKSAVVDEDVRDLYKTHQFSKIAVHHEDDGLGRIKVYFYFREIPNTVEKISFRGAKHIKEEELCNLTGVRAKRPLNPNLNLMGCKRIEEAYEDRGRSFAHCKLVKGGDVKDTEVVYEITEGPKVQIKNIQFVGNTFVSGARLAASMKSSSCWYAIVGGTYNKEIAESDIKSLCEYYRKFGYRDAKVSLETQRSGDSGETTLIFHIQEGERTRPAKPATDPDKIKLESPVEQNGPTGASAGDAAASGSSSKTILTERSGFSEESHASYFGSYVSMGGSIPIIAKVTIHGFDRVRGAELRRAAGVHPGDIYWSKCNMEARCRIEELYERRGYPLVRCELLKGGEKCGWVVSFQITEGPHVSTLGRIPALADVDRAMCQTARTARTAPLPPLQTLQEKPPARIGQILLTGNKRISTESILDHVPLVPGQILSYIDLQQAENLLAELGLFVVDPLAGIRPTISVVDAESGGDVKDIVIAVKEKPATKAH